MEVQNSPLKIRGARPACPTPAPRTTLAGRGVMKVTPYPPYSKWGNERNRVLILRGMERPNT